MRVAIVKYNAGNVQSVANALSRLGVESQLSDDPQILHTADKVIFPGVGEASSAMNYLRGRNLDATIKSLKQPVLAICLGMQLLCTSSEENDTECLGVFSYSVHRFSQLGPKVPHTGWNSISNLSSSLFDGVTESERVYFVHSYYVGTCDATVATTDYGLQFSAAAIKHNFYAVQFHPEKSGRVGAKILENFLQI